MTDKTVSTNDAGNALDEAQVETVGGGTDHCSPDAILGITSSLTQAYENLVDFTSHVIERVAIK
jgi:hypothetical protein